MRLFYWVFILTVLHVSCQNRSESRQEASGSFAEDLDFLKKHLEVVVLSDLSGQTQVAVVPAYQGRVMTSTATGPGGNSYGWINYEQIESGQWMDHINPFGGEDRFWLGPEGGQFSIFFPRDTQFNLDNWQTPAPIDSEAYEIVSQSPQSIEFSHLMELENYSGTTLKLRVDREIRLLDLQQAERLLDVNLEGLAVVAYQSENTISNTGQDPWVKENGLLSIWILGMFKPSSQTTVAIPYRQAADSTPVVNDNYFGKVPDDRLKIDENDQIIFFSGDGEFRSKIGLPTLRAKNIVGSYDALTNTLTLVQYNKPENVTDYVNSMWEIQDQPYRGDVINAYNDGPPEPGKEPLGPFYELETSSPAAALKPGESLTHIHRTFHIEGKSMLLNNVTESLLGVNLAKIEQAF